MKRLRLSHRRLILLFLPLSILLLFFARTFPSFAEWYATGPYLLLSRWGNFLSSTLPYSIGELLVLTLIPAGVGYLFYCLFKCFTSKGNRRTIFRILGRNLLCTGSVILFLFTISCGINYNRYTFAQTSGLTISPSTKEELQDLCRSLVQEVNELRGQVEVDSDGIMCLSSNISGTAGQAQASMRAASVDYPLIKGTFNGPKPVFFSRGLSACNITGIFFPFTFEANVNTDIPAYSLPYTMCHELAHLSGFMREDEANFIAYLACERSERPDFRYSGKVLAYIYASNALYAEDAKAAQEISATLEDDVRLDLNAGAAYWKQFESPVAEAAERVNNTYLKANQQEDGVKSYGRVVDLLLAEYREKLH